MRIIAAVVLAGAVAWHRAHVRQRPWSEPARGGEVQVDRRVGFVIAIALGFAAVLGSVLSCAERKTTGGQPGQGSPVASPSANAALEGTYWRAIELAGLMVPAQDANREPHLTLESGRASGSDGCNRVAGPYTLQGEALTFGAMAGTRMACPDTAEIESRFQGALKGTSHWRIASNRLELYGATGKPLAVFERRVK